MHLHYTEDRLESFEVNKMIDIDPSTVSLRAKSHLTECSQTTIPAAIRDAYQVFASMLSTGSPPDDWETLSQEAKMATKAVDLNSAIGFLLKNNG